MKGIKKIILGAAAAVVFVAALWAVSVLAEQNSIDIQTQTVERNFQSMGIPTYFVKEVVFTTTEKKSLFSAEPEIKRKSILTWKS